MPAADARRAWFDRSLAKLGLIHDAAPQFRAGDRVPRAGALLARPARRPSGVVEIARAAHGSPQGLCERDLVFGIQVERFAAPSDRDARSAPRRRHLG
ncbi:MAG TPA: hypothetical protein VFK02_14430, partial [Kofleriaceae bacterium]|nr:hypothetical protein [Kofleriaceae bacterium]